MLVTLFVLNEEKFIDSKDEQFRNILFILVTLLALNEDKSKDFKDEQ